MAEHEALFEQFLARRGLKLTSPRRQILATVFSLHEHFDAEQLHATLKNDRQGISLATVYRTLPLLVEAGLIQLSLRSSSRGQYEHIYGHPRHIHWVCSRCGQVQETGFATLDSILRKEAAKLKFNPDEISIQVNGRCWKCQAEANESQ